MEGMYGCTIAVNYVWNIYSLNKRDGKTNNLDG